jgi:dihydrofolate synthase/folylpolyglutamate synthase
VELAVLEVGLGGRFDSTNVCWPALAIITSISHDHTDLLGNTLAAIAGEKAGIVKPGRPVLSGARDPDARAVIQDVCRRRAAPLRELGVELFYHHRPGEVTGEMTRLPRIQITTTRRRWPEVELGLLGEHQAANAALVVAAVEELCRQGMHISDAAVSKGLVNVQWPARLEVLGCKPLVVLDCAHNVASIQAMLDTLDQSFPSHSTSTATTNGQGRRGRRILVFASSNDKDVAGIIQLLGPHFSHAYLTRYADNPRSVPPEQLQNFWQRASNSRSTACPTAPEAWQAARASAGPDDLICITGSVYLAGQLRPLLDSSQ